MFRILIRGLKSVKKNSELLTENSEWGWKKEAVKLLVGIYGPRKYKLQIRHKLNIPQKLDYPKKCGCLLKYLSLGLDIHPRTNLNVLVMDDTQINIFSKEKHELNWRCANERHPASSAGWRILSLPMLMQTTGLTVFSNVDYFQYYVVRPFGF